MESKFKGNPWFSILTKPKETIRSIVESNPNYCLWILSFIYGFSAIISAVQNISLGDTFSLPVILVFVVVFATLWGYLSFSVSSFFMYYTGKVLGGKAQYKHIRAVAAWSSVPSIVSSFMWILLLLIFGIGVFNNFAHKEMLSPGIALTLFAIMFIQLIASVWSLVIYINALAEVQGFSILRSIGNILLGAVSVGLVVLIIALICKWTCSPFFDSPAVVMLFQ